MTGGAAAQQIDTGGLSVDPFSLLFRVEAPRWTIQTLSGASTETPMVMPSSPSLGKGFRPQRVDLEHRGFHHGALLRGGLALHHDRTGAEADQARHEGDAAQQVMSLF